MVVSFEDSVDDEQVLANILQKNLEISHNHWLDLPFPSEQIDCDLFS